MKLPLKIKRTGESFGIVDSVGTMIAYVYFDNDVDRASVRKRMHEDEARDIAQFVARALTDRWQQGK